MRSRPAWARGLKHLNRSRPPWLHSSRPAWARGLKHRPSQKFLCFALQSRPAWARGLKHFVGVVG